MSSVSANAAALTALREQAQAYLAKKPALPQATTPNPYGSITQSYQSERIVTSDSEDRLDLTKINASTAANPNTGVGAGLLAIGQAIKTATPVDPGTGVAEISASALNGLTKSLEKAFSALLDESAATYQTNTGGLSEADIDAAVTQAVQQYASGKGNGALSLSLSTTKNSLINTSTSTAGVPGLNASYAGQGVAVTSRQMTLSISLSADGKLSSSFQDTELDITQGTQTENGIKGANAVLNPAAWFGTTYTVDSQVMGGLQDSAGIPSFTELNSLNEAFNESSHMVIQPSTDQNGIGLETIDNARHGDVIATLGQDENGSFSSQEAVLKSVTAAAQAFRDAAKNIVTAKVTITSTLAVSLTDTKGQSTILYARPDGTLGTFGTGSLNSVA